MVLLAQPNMKRKLPSQLQAGDKTMDKDTGSGDEEKVTMTNRKEGPHEDCVKNKFVVLRETYEDSSKGVDVYKIVNTTSNQVNQGFVGKHYVPSTLGLSTTDPKCVRHSQMAHTERTVRPALGEGVFVF